MKSRLFAAVAVACAVALSGDAQVKNGRNGQNVPVKNGIEHSPLACVRAGELPLLQVKTQMKGELRGYFRRINTTDWCSVEGVNEGPLSRVVLPKFENGDEIEYFFVLLDEGKVAGRSSRIYRTRVTAECSGAVARHLIKLDLSCGDDAQAIPSSMTAGYLVGDEIIRGNPPTISPDEPATPPNGGQ